MYDAGRHEDHYYIAAACIDGPTLADAIPDAGTDVRRVARLVKNRRTAPRSS